ncbi:D-alanine--D-serine ligase VanG [Ruminococcus sp. OA3]|uniref:D-alanine--D-serine ligase VanG n=1 Tax=Ruminococcus sp. OA3 TaxID=2914164 RepID=UPI001F06C1FD|nr:D-alanine--D-serine ligase VanG [Ruminococcus sp. OA3]MCH1982537.1 D-alanine--D-serine ligase VanG [Ruminococcus sp. OA3]
MGKKRLAVIFGGNSTEYCVSLQSAYSVLEAVDKEKYEVIPIGITRQGNWYRYRGAYGKIPEDAWLQDEKELTPVIVHQNPAVHGIVELAVWENRVTPLDLAFPILHGKNGEDGTVQGLLELAGIPVVGCSVLSSALCMDKDRAHRLAGTTGISVPKAVVLQKNQKSRAVVVPGDFVYPLFVKPVRAGSSCGIAKIYGKEELDSAVCAAFCHDDEVIVEEHVDGFEVGCAILGTEDLTVGRVDEIELTDGFFDFTEKYTLKSSRIHMPARIDRQTEQKIQETAKIIYRTLGCSGFARVDMFLTPTGDIVFNEVNTIPGFTAHSRYPNMMKGIGLSFEKLLERLLGMYDE